MMSRMDWAVDFDNLPVNLNADCREILIGEDSLDEAGDETCLSHGEGADEADFLLIGGESTIPHYRITRSSGSRGIRGEPVEFAAGTWNPRQISRGGASISREW